MREYRDNGMSEMARRTKLLENDIRNGRRKPVTNKQKKNGKIVFWVLLGIVLAIAVVYGCYHIWG